MSTLDMEKWAALARRALEPNPMCEPQCVGAAARNLPYGPEIALVVVDDGDRFHAVTPIRRLPRFGRLRLPVVTTDIRRMTWLGTPLVDPDEPVRAWMSLIKTVSAERRQRHWRLLVIRWMHDGPVAAALAEATKQLQLPSNITEDFEQPFLTRRGDGNYTSGQSKHHLSDYRRRARRLSELLGADLEVEDVGTDPASVREYIELEAAGYKSENGVAMRTQEGECDYFTEMCAAFAKENRLHVLRMRAGNRTISMQVSIEADGGLFLIKVGHDEEFNRYDPGIQLHLAALDHFHAQRSAQWLAVCTFPENELLLRMYEDRRRTLTAVVGLEGALNSGIARAIPSTRRATHTLRGLRQSIRSTHRR